MGFLEFGSLSFAIFSIVAILTVIFFASKDIGLFATAALVVAGGILLWRNPGGLTWLLDNLAMVLIAATIYLVIGVAWSFFKWILKVKRAYEAKQARKIEQEKHYRENYKWKTKTTEEPLEPTATMVLADWNATLRENQARYPEIKRPEASKSMGLIISWMAYWPVSALSFGIFDALTELFKTIYRRCLKLYDRLTDHYFPDAQ